jgi:hypothetical protein
MMVGRTILAFLLAVSLALLPLAGASAFDAAAPAAAADDGTSAAHDCCHGAPCHDHQSKPAGNHASMAGCAKCCSGYLGAEVSPALAAPPEATVLFAAVDTSAPSRSGHPPFRPPRA